MLNTLKTYFISFEIKNLKILLVFQGLSKSNRSFGEDAIVVEAKFGDVLFVQKHLRDLFGATRTNKVLRKKKLPKGRLLSDGFTNSDATIRHDFVVRQV